MEKKKTTQQIAERIEKNKRERFAGKRCNCFYRGSIYRCEVKELIGRGSYTKCFIEELGIEVSLLCSKVNWNGDAKLEERWLDEYEAKRDKQARIKELEDGQKQVIKNILYGKTHRYQPKKVTPAPSGLELQLLKAQKNRIANLCGVGSRAVKSLLNGLARRGEAIHLLYSLALEIEQCNLQCVEYRGKFQGRLREKRYFAWTDFLKRCQESGIHIGIPKENPDVVCVALPDCATLAFPLRQWKIRFDSKQPFTGIWDGKTRMNIRHLEDALTAKYGEVLRAKYPERFPKD